jgi:two-component system chemotaxis response regulator CheB
MNGKINLNQNAPRCGLRPAVDVTMEAAARVYGSRCLGVILTGMGNDGTLGAAMVRAAGGRIIVEDESTCVVYGMPKSVVDSGFADKIAPLHQIAQEVVAVCNQTNRASMKV